MDLEEQGVLHLGDTGSTTTTTNHPGIVSYHHQIPGTFKKLCDDGVFAVHFILQRHQGKSVFCEFWHSGRWVELSAVVSISSSLADSTPRSLLIHLLFQAALFSTLNHWLSPKYPRPTIHPPTFRLLILQSRRPY